MHQKYSEFAQSSSCNFFCLNLLLNMEPKEGFYPGIALMYIFLFGVGKASNSCCLIIHTRGGRNALPGFRSPLILTFILSFLYCYRLLS